MQFSAALVMVFATFSIPSLEVSPVTLDVGTDFAAVSKEDIKFLNDVNDLGNAAEKEGFNPALEAATGDAKIAVGNGKTKNKILKLMASVLELKAEGAQGKGTAAKLAEEQKKLDNNIAKDKANAGQPSTALKFEGTAGGATSSTKKNGDDATKTEKPKETKAPKSTAAPKA
ncbi:hypothetical protein HYALB_00011469 [Hymenoscyphus albidus]|uniref:Small secreted protein n=1 Tax=Hymenoscyphus albidus TaxID=595503 RepID=A0A9N9PUC3_9HELO|nr:hypothetical protein HYALB_00011469 [Hymenoscyphus albidus]